MSIQKTVIKNIFDYCPTCKGTGKGSAAKKCYSCSEQWKISSYLLSCEVCSNMRMLSKVCEECSGRGICWQPYKFLLSFDHQDFIIVNAWVYVSPLEGVNAYVFEKFNHYELLYQLRKTGNKRSMYCLTTFGTGENKRWEILFDQERKQPKRRMFNIVCAKPKLKKNNFTFKDIAGKICQLGGQYIWIIYNCQYAVKSQWQLFFEGQCPVK